MTGLPWPRSNQHELDLDLVADRDAYINQLVGQLQGAMSVCNYIIWAHMAGPGPKIPRVTKIVKSVERAQANLDQALKEAIK